MFGSAFAKVPPVTPQELSEAPLLATPASGEYLSTHVAQAFDRTIPGRVMEEQAILDAEKAEGTYDPDYLPQREVRDMFGSFPDMPELRHAHAIPEDEWKASPYYRKGVQYRPDMTATRARILSENYDERRFREMIVANGDAAYGPGMKAAAFGAMLLGSLPDPVNVLPLGGGVRAASLVGKAGLKAAIGAGAKAGIVEGAAGALLSDALTLPDLAARGEDVGFVDVMLDTAFGASLGGGLGALGGGIGGYLGKRRAQAQALLAERALLRHAELLREADAREKAALAVTTEFGAPDNDFLNSGWHAFEDNSDDFFLSRTGREGGPGAPLATRAETFFGLLDDVDLDIARRDRWRIWTAEFQKQLEGAGFSSQKAEAFSDVLGAHAEVMAPMYGMEPGQWLEHRLAGFRQMSPEEFAAVREGFLYDAPGREAADLRQAAGEGRRANPIADAVWGQLDHAAIREGYGQDVVRAIEERYGHGVFARTSGGRAKDRATLSNDSLASELARRGLLPEGATLDDMVNHLAYGEGMDNGRALFMPLNPGVNLDAPVRVVGIVPRFSGQKLWSLIKGVGRADLRREIIGTYNNADTGWRINLTGQGVDHAISSAKKSMNGNIHMEAVANLPRLIERAMLVESHADRKGQGLKAVHRMYAPMQMGNDVYAVKLTVKELDIGRIAEIEDVRKLYDLMLEKKMPGDLRQGPGIAQNATGKLGSTPGISEISLRSLLEDVNDSEGQAFFQPADMATSLPVRFAEMPTLEADSSHWFGKGKEIPVPGKSEDSGQRKALRDAVKAWAKKRFSKDTAVSNADTGWQVQVTPKGIEDSLSHGFDDLLARSVPFVPDIIKSGIHLDSIEKKPGLMSHIFANKIRLDGNDYVVGFVLREDRMGNRFYDHELTEIINPDWLAPGRDTSKEALGHRTNRGDVMNILREKLGVNDGSGQVLFHAAGGDPTNARGAIVFRPEDGQALIALFKGKRDISTVIHEGAGHFFLENLRDAAQQSNAPAWVRDGWRDVAKAIGADADAAKTVPVDAHEKFARMIVDYFRRGEAPTPVLTTTFQRFARWLTRIYRALARKGDLEGVSPEVARIMDRMLASEDDLRAREINRRVDSARNDDADLLRAGLAGREKRDIMRAQEKALADMSAGRPVDVGPVLRESQALNKAGNLMRDFPLDGQPASEINGPAVNYAVEAADDFPPAPERARGEAAESADALNQAAVDADVEARLGDLEAQGKLDAEDAAHLAEAADRQARAANYNEWGQAVLECVWGIA